METSRLVGAVGGAEVPSASSALGNRSEPSQQQQRTAMPHGETPLARALAELAPESSAPRVSKLESPLAAIMAVSARTSAIALRAPSSVDLTHVRPDAAHPAVLVAVPGPSPGARVRAGAVEAARLVREVVWPTVKRGGQRAWTVAHACGSLWWGRMLDFLRPRLPARFRAASPAILGFIVGAMVALPIMMLLVLVWPSGERHRPRATTNVSRDGY